MDSSEKQKILIFGGTGYIGQHLVRASSSLGHKTYVYARPVTPQSNPTKIAIRKEFEPMGVTIIEGELDEEKKLESIIKEVDVVISALAYPQVFDQLKIIDCIKRAPNIKRFLPAEFGADGDRVSPLPPFQAVLDKKKQIRRAVEAANIPYTFISANCCGCYFINFLLRPYEERDDITVYGSGEAKAVLNDEDDIGIYTIKAATDPRMRNKVVICRPAKNITTQLDLISLWEKKTGRTFKRTHVHEDELVKLSETLPDPDNIPVSILHSVFVKGETMSYEVDGGYIEASDTYLDVKYKPIDKLLDVFLSDHPPKPAAAVFK